MVGLVPNLEHFFMKYSSDDRKKALTYIGNTQRA